MKATHQHLDQTHNWKKWQMQSRIVDSATIQDKCYGRRVNSQSQGQRKHSMGAWKHNERSLEVPQCSDFIHDLSMVSLIAIIKHNDSVQIMDKEGVCKKGGTCMIAHSQMHVII